VIAIEILCACQAIDLLAPLTTSPPLAEVHRLVRSRVPILDHDRALSADIVAIAQLIRDGALEAAGDGRVK
jgi:histidine ammonia-lyase